MLRQKLEDFLKEKEVRVYRNDDVEKIIAGIPRGHHHLRMAIVLKDQVLVFHEATIAAIVRAYIDVVTHPLRRAIVLAKKVIDSKEKKHGYARVQQLEEDVDEEEAVEFIEQVLGFTRA